MTETVTEPMEDENGDPLLEEDSYTDDDFSFDDGEDDDLL